MSIETIVYLEEGVRNGIFISDNAIVREEPDY